MSNVRQVLKSKHSSVVWSIAPHESVYRAIALMSEHNIGALLVMDGEDIVGIVTERDYARKVILQNRSSKSTPVSDIMSSEVLYVTPEEEVDSCMAIMTEQRVRHLPVLEEGRLIGLISIGDIVKAMVSDREFLIDELTRYITGSPHVDGAVLYQISEEQIRVRML